MPTLVPTLTAELLKRQQQVTVDLETPQADIGEVYNLFLPFSFSKNFLTETFMPLSARVRFTMMEFLPPLGGSR